MLPELKTNSVINEVEGRVRVTNEVSSTRWAEVGQSQGYGHETKNATLPKKKKVFAATAEIVDQSHDEKEQKPKEKSALTKDLDEHTGFRIKRRF